MKIFDNEFEFNQSKGLNLMRNVGVFSRGMKSSSNSASIFIYGVVIFGVEFGGTQ